METKIEALDDDMTKDAFDQGVALTELMGQFAFFLNKTPDGIKAKKELERRWQETCIVLREEKLIKGPEFSLEAWLKELQKEVLNPGKSPKEKKMGEKKVNLARSNKKIEKKPVQKFKNIK